MIEINVRKILEYPAEAFVARLKSSVSVRYDDDIVIRHSAHELAVNRYVYSLLETLPELPIVSKYSIHNYYVGGHYTATTIHKSFEAMLKDIVIKYVTPTKNRQCLEDIYGKMYIIMEGVYNDIIYPNLEYVSSLSIRDFLDIQLDPELMAAIDTVRDKKDLASVEHTYEVLDKVIRTTKSLENNTIARGYVSGTISSNQVKQLLASRGFVTEIDSTIFKYPIASSFVLGMDNMYDMAVESRSGAKALYLSNMTIALSEYFAREMQLTTMSVERLVDGDCGNTEYYEWMVSKDDFKNLLGKSYYIDGVSKTITPKDTRLIDTTIHIRNSFRCKLSNKRHVCTGCFGELSNNIPLHSNLGHITLTILSALISQRILSTKHITTSASSDTISLTGVMKDFFIVKNKNSYALRANTISKKKHEYNLHIPQEQGCGLSDLPSSTDVRKLNLARISRLELIHLSITDGGGGYIEHPLHIKQGGKYGNFTYAFLEYIKNNGYTLDTNDRIVINLENWSTGVPIISLPQVEFNYIDLADAIKEEFKSMKTAFDTPEAFLHKLFDLVNNKLDINIAILETIVYAFTTVDPDNGDYDLGRNSPTAKPAKMINIVTNRSVGGAYAWEYVMKTLLSPGSFYGNNNIDHPLDVMVKPNEVLLDYNKTLN